MIFTKRLKQLRNQHHLTQQQMCERLFMDQSTYSRYESGCTVPTTTFLLQLSNEFGVSIDWLLKDNFTHQHILQTSNSKENK